jgi:hypothetical protein
MKKHIVKRGTCLECKKFGGLKNRGLCWKCHKDISIRMKYPPIKTCNKFGSGGRVDDDGDFNGGYILPLTTCQNQQGSEERILTLQERVAAKVAIFRPGDKNYRWVREPATILGFERPN